MKNLYFKTINSKLQYLVVLIALLLGNAFTADAQVRVNFTQRTSQYTPTKKIYNVKGDFTMLGNTCLTPQNYGDNTNNNGQVMKYVDTDGDSNTFNSSSATLQLSTENGAIPSCSNIVYAGLYWTGKSSGSNNTFEVTKSVPNGTQTINNTFTVVHNQDITNTNYTMVVTRNNPSNNNRSPIYTFSGNGNTYVFNYTNTASPTTVTLSVNGGSAVNVPVTITTGGGNATATLTTPYVITDGTVTLKINKLIRSTSTSQSTNDTQSSSTAEVTVAGTIPAFANFTKTFDKRVISLKGPNSAAYTQFTANASDIYYPTGGTDDDIYTAYKEITDYVRTNGIGQYWAADLALLEGNVGGTGYSGGWGIIVVYENAKMKWRDVTVFDGYAYVESGNNSGLTLPVSGFNTVQSGSVGVKLGLMASEGDVAYTGDYFQIQKNSDSSYLSLSHSGNSTTNFFNSSINAGGVRNPSLPNNTGIDIAMFNVPNANNSVIANNQTSTNFKYGTDGDTYSIFAIAMAVDAYIPEPEGIITTTTINNTPAVMPYTVMPGQEVGFNVDVRNLGTEAINNYKIVVPIPYNANYVPGSAVGTVLFTPLPTPNNVYFDAALGANGSVVWDFGKLPLPASPSTLLAKLTFKMKATTNCQILSNASCGSALSVIGTSSGTGATTGIVFTGTKLIQGYTANGICVGEPIANPLTINIDGAAYVAANCAGTPVVRNFFYCSSATTVPVSEIASNFPAGSLFYDSFPVTMVSIQFTTTFPLVAGSTVTYYAIPPTSGSSCNYAFTIAKCRPIIANDDAGAVVNGTTGGTAFTNVLVNDTLNGQPVLANQVNTTFVSSTNPGITLSGTNVLVAPGTPGGSYTLTYRICEIANPTNCDDAIVTVTVSAPLIDANADLFVNVSCASTGIVGNIFTNDLLNGSVVTAGLVNFTLLTGSNPNITIASNGNITVNSGIAAGTYTFSYRICQILNPSNCDTAIITVTITDTTAPTIATLPGTTTINCPATPAFQQAVATDTCSTPTLTFNDVTTPGICAGTYSVTRTWTATDGSGNITNATQTINVVDNTAPVIAALPGLTTINCPATPVFAQATATDACGSTFTLTSNDVTTPGACAGAYSVTRTWTATDACGNISHASQTINVEDHTGPVIAQLPAISTINCPAVPEFTQATAIDACGSSFTLTFNDVTTPGACAGTYSVTRTWTATDTCGNISNAAQTIKVEDHTAPVIAQLPATSTINCPATPAFAQATATDSCGSIFTLTSNDVTTPGICAGTYSVTRTWTATDACGNSSNASQTINVEDHTGPVIAQLPATSTINCPAVPAFAQATATDACGSTFTLTSNDVTTPGICAGTYSVTRTWTATDACGNISNATQTINVEDHTGPVIAQLPAPSTINCPAVPEFMQATATDACGSTFTLTSNDVTTPGLCAGTYSVTRTWTATDACGNSSNASQTINVEDHTAPVIAALPALSTINCPATPEFAQATAIDACGSTFTLTSNDVTTPGACAGTYSVTRTWTATDACGNSSNASQTINVEDHTAPVIAALPALSTINCPATPEFAQATAIDACGSTFTLTSNDVTTTGACAGTYSVTRTWTATDACGNASNASQTINVEDHTAPVIAQLPAPSTINCPATPEFAQATATDACGSTFTLTSNDVTTPGTCAGMYSVTRTWTATDACGNTSNASQTINVEDHTAPVIAALPGLSTINCPATPVFEQATAVDACGSTFTLTSNDVTTPGQCAGSYSVTRTWTATDACGNISNASQTINVEDHTAPVIAQLPAPSTINCPAVPEFAQATATDECGSTFTLTSNDVTTPGACAGMYSVTRTWTATDACGNISNATQTINVEDHTAPVIAALPDVTTINCPNLPVFEQATAVDACGSVFVLTFNDVTTPGSCAGNYSVTRTWTAIDACGNSSNKSQTVNVHDITAPIIITQASNITVNCDGSGNQTAIADWLANHGGATATDVCSDVTWTNNFNALSNDCSAAVTVIFTAADACGNASTTAATFTVQDIVAPAAPEAPADVTVACASEVPAMVSLTAIDACAGPITAQGVDAVTPGSCPNSYIISRSWTFTDACGNSSSAVQAIIVNDTVAPIAPEAPATVTVACTSEVPAMVSLTANDNCGDQITAEGIDAVSPGSCPNSYTVTRTWTFTDACGNTSSTTQTINVNDTVAPIAPEAPATVTVACASEVPAMVSLTAADNCGDQITAEGVDAVTPGSCPNSYTVTRTWTFTDACGNSSSTVQTINVNDTVAPIAPEAPATVTVACASEVPAMVSLTANDNCGDQITAEGVDVTTPGSCPNSYTVTRTWTFTDACGNTSSTTQTINVNDTVAPVAPEAPATVTVACASEVPAMVSLTAADNCGDQITAEGVDVTTPGSCPNSYTVTRTWTFTDACGNSSSTVQTINVNDTVPPVIAELPATSTISCPATPSFAEATATDNCAGTATLTFADVNTPGACAGSYSVTRTWTATDLCGNTATASQTINVEDTTAPTMTAEAANITVECDGTGNQTALTEWLANHGGAVATDTCSDVTWTNNFSTIGNDCSAAVTVIFTATDACGNASTSSASFSVHDTVAPTAPEAPAVVTVACATDVPAMVSLSATDNCSGIITAQGVDATTPGACANSYTVVRTWTFTDACGNTSSTSQTININDTVAPTAPEAPATVTVACASDVPAMISLTAADNCGDQITAEGVDAITPGACPNSYTVTRTWTFTDACGNSSSTAQTINVIDNVAPVIAELPATSTIACPATPVFAEAAATDNCGGTATLTFADVTTNGTCAGAYSVTRTWTATDLCGNTSTASQTINVQDLTAPVIAQLPAATTIACGTTPQFAEATASDACGSAFTLTSADVTVNGACAGSYSVTRTWTATDACGNIATASQTINVEDTTAPVFDALSPSITVECPAIPSFTQAVATDACGSAVTMTFADVTTTGPNGETVVTRTWTATDACGNASNATQSVTVADTMPPVTQPLPNVTGECSACAVAPTALDACMGTVTGTTTDQLCYTQQGTYVIHWMFSDGNGNVSMQNQTVIVDDTIAPVTPVIADMTGQCEVTVPAPTTTDTCAGTITGTTTDAIHYDVVGTHVITWTFDDGNGNITTATQNAIVTAADTAIAISSSDASCNNQFDVTFDLNNYLTQAGLPLGGTWTAMDNEGATHLTGSVFSPYQVSVGNHVFHYEITVGTCPKTADLTMLVDDDCPVLPCGAIFINNAFSPNGDNINEVFFIENISEFTCYPTNNVEIYNRWGVLVYETNQYDNVTHVFAGRSEGRVTVAKSDELPTGTYFYIIKYFDSTIGKEIKKDGYLYLTR